MKELNKMNKVHKPLISVIVPVYNAEIYLYKCISSILNQSYKNLEIILVDDGSNDDSLEICNLLKKQDARIIVLTGSNKGVSSARNKGLNYAHGEWITFVDADDLISMVFIEALFNATGNNPSIIAATRLKRFTNEEQLTNIEQENIKKIEHCPLHTLNIKDAICYAHMKDTFCPNHCNKLYHISMLQTKDKEPLRFNENIYYGEDQVFFHSALVNCKQLNFVALPLYYYRIHQASAMQQLWNPKRDTVLEAYKQIYEIVKLYDEGKRFLPYIMFQDTCVGLFLQRAQIGIIDPALQEYMKSIVKKRFIYYLECEEIHMKRKLFAILFLLCPNLIIKVKTHLQPIR